MKEYYGTELLDRIEENYRRRTFCAVDRCFADPGSRYYRIYVELRVRTRFIGRVKAFISELRQYMDENTPEESAGHTVRWITGLFSDGNCETEPDAEGNDLVLSDGNPICRDLIDSIRSIGTEHDLKDEQWLYEDLCECAVRAARLYLQLREKRFCAIDREDFGGLMRVRAEMQDSA